MTPSSPTAASNFEFLRDDFLLLYTLGKEVEFQLYPDPTAALFKLRLYGEKLVDQLFAEHRLVPLVDNTQHHRLGELKCQRLLPRQVEDILYLLKKKGNAAAHDNVGSLTNATLLLQSAFYLGKLLANTYGLGETEVATDFMHLVQQDTQRELAQFAAEKDALQQRGAELQANLAARPAFTAPQLAELQQSRSRRQITST